MDKFTFRDLKEAIAKLTEEQLDHTVVLYREEDGLHVEGLDMEPEDRYVNKDEPEDQGTMEQLQEWHEGEEGFTMDDYLLIPKGRPFLWEKF